MRDGNNRARRADAARGTFARLFALAGVTVLSAGIAAAQSPSPQPNPTDEPAPLRVPAPRQAPAPEARVGVDESNPLPIALAEAVEMALTRNRDIEIERINTQQAGYDVDAARGYYDVFLHSTDYYDNSVNPVASTLGGGANGRVKTTTISSDLTLRRAFKSGGSLEIGAQHLKTDTDNVFSSVNPQYQTALKLTFRQPLLRGLRMDDNRRRLAIANLKLDQSDAQFRQRVIETIGAVQRGYWDLVYSLRNVQVTREAVTLAEEQLQRLQRLVQEGINAPAELAQVEAELERRRQNVFAALESVTVAENNLKGLILAERASAEWNRPLVPTDSARVTPVTYTLGDAVTTAIQNRPDLASLLVQEQINEVDRKYFKDQAKPQVDLFGSYGLSGLAGAPVLSGNPFSGQNDALRARVNELSEQLGLEPLPTPPTTSVPGQLLGGEGRSFSNLFSNDFRAVRIGVEINIPIQNRTAEANLGRAEAEGRKILAERQSLEQRVEREVRNALQSVQTARQRVDASVAAREAAEVQLASEQRRYDAGLSTTFLVLTRQNDLSDARGRELQALTDYNKAVAELQRVVGITLSANQIDVKDVKGEAPER